MEELELSAEFITANGLTEDQVNAIKGESKSQLDKVRSTWDGQANERAEKIISGAVKPVEETSKIARNQGEKVADYLARVGSSFIETSVSARNAELDRLKTEYQDKIKGMTGTEQLQAELDKYQKRVAELEPLEEIKTKYEALATEYDSMKDQTAFTLVKPSFPDSVNPYEAKAKWDAFVKEVKDKNNIVIVDGVAIAVDKENNHKQKPLEELVKAHKELQELVNFKASNGGLGSNNVKTVKVDGVPFEIPENATVEEKTKAIKAHLAEKGLPVTSREYTTAFSELMNKINASKK